MARFLYAAACIAKRQSALTAEMNAFPVYVCADSEEDAAQQIQDLGLKRFSLAENWTNHNFSAIQIPDSTILALADEIRARAGGMTDQPLKLVIEETEHGVKKRTYAGDILSYQITVYEPDHYLMKDTGKSGASAWLMWNDAQNLATARFEADTTEEARQQAEAWVQARYSEAAALLLAHFQGGAE